MATHRTKFISTRVTEEEYGVFRYCAGKLSVSEWARATLLRGAAGPSPFDVLQLAELLATQRLLVNLFGKIAADQKEPLTTDVIKRLQAEINDDKLQRAQARLGLVPQP